MPADITKAKNPWASRMLWNMLHPTPGDMKFIGALYWPNEGRRVFGLEKSLTGALGDLERKRLDNNEHPYGMIGAVARARGFDIKAFLRDKPCENAIKYFTGHSRGTLAFYKLFENRYVNDMTLPVKYTDFSVLLKKVRLSKEDAVWAVEYRNAMPAELKAEAGAPEFSTLTTENLAKIKQEFGPVGAAIISQATGVWPGLGTTMLYLTDTKKAE